MPMLDEALLIEQAVGREKDLPMNVADARLGTAQGSVQGGVVIPVTEFLVEPQRHIHRRRAGQGVLRGKVTE